MIRSAAFCCSCNWNIIERSGRQKRNNCYIEVLTIKSLKNDKNIEKIFEKAYLNTSLPVLPCFISGLSDEEMQPLNKDNVNTDKND